MCDSQTVAECDPIEETSQSDALKCSSDTLGSAVEELSITCPENSAVGVEQKNPQGLTRCGRVIVVLCAIKIQ